MAGLRRGAIWHVWLVFGAIVVLDRQRPAAESLVVHGLVDEAAHALMAYLVALAVRSLGVPVSLVWAVVGGVIVDVDHGLQLLGWTQAIPGSSRGGGHALLVTLVPLVIGVIACGWRTPWTSLAIGMASHLFRDMATGTVALLWPFDATPFAIRHGVYLAILAVVTFAGSLSNRNRRSPLCGVSSSG